MTAGTSSHRFVHTAESRRESAALRKRCAEVSTDIIPTSSLEASSPP